MNRKQFEHYIINECILTPHWLVKHNVPEAAQLLHTDDGEYENEDVFYHYQTWKAAKRSNKDKK